MRILLILLMLCTSLGAEERLGLDPICRGTWTSYGSWTQNAAGTKDCANDKEWDWNWDKGKEFAVAGARTIKVLENGAILTYNITKVRMFNDDHGKPANMLTLSNGMAITLHKKVDNPFFRAEFYDDIDNKYVLKDVIVFKVSKD